jgi:ATP-dependent protease ClpP protease subunit
MKKNPWTFKAAGRGALTIELFEQIGSDIFSEGTTAKSFSDDLAAAGPGITDIRLEISSPGGSVFEGLAIYDLLVRHPADVTAHVMFAASIASVIAMAARKITMSPTSVMMIHQPYSVVGGDAAEHRKMAGALDRVADAMVVGYRRHTKKTKAEVAALMAAETWMSATEAVAAGFAEEVSDSESDDDEDVAAAVRAPIFAKFKHVPAQIAARLRSHPADDSQPVACDERERLRARPEVLRRLP